MLYGWVENKGAFAAKDIFINAHLYSDNFEIEIFGFTHQIVKQNNDGVLFKIDAIPPESQAAFMIKAKIPCDGPGLADFDKLPRHKSVFFAAPFVTHVYYQHGEIPEYHPPKWPLRP